MASPVRGRGAPSSGGNGAGVTRRDLLALAAFGMVAGTLEFAAASGPQGQLTWGVHTTLAPTWFDPAETPGIITPWMVLYALHDALVKPMPGNPLTPSLAESFSAAEDDSAKLGVSGFPGIGFTSASCSAYKTIHGVMIPGVSAGSNQVGASVVCTPQVNCPCGPDAAANSSVPATIPKAASAKRSRRVTPAPLPPGDGAPRPLTGDAIALLHAAPFAKPY